MKNNKILVLLNEEKAFMEKVFKYNIKTTDIIIIPNSYTPFDREKLALTINSKYEQLVFYGYYDQFYLLLPLISKKVVKKYIINVGIPKLYEQYMMVNLQQIFEYKERGLIDYIFTTRYDLYISFKNKISYIALDYKCNNEKEKNSNSIGILNQYYLEESNFYNELSAIALSKYKKAVILDQNIITKKFGEDFSVEIEVEKDIEKLIFKNIVNLDCKFCDVSYFYFLMSMDAKIPCILGNTNLLDDCEELKNYLVLKSDDDVNEIKEKIEKSVSNLDKINNLYSNWRKKYTTNSVATIKEFIKIGGKNK